MEWATPGPEVAQRPHSWPSHLVPAGPSTLLTSPSKQGRAVFLGVPWHVEVQREHIHVEGAGTDHRKKFREGILYPGQQARVLTGGQSRIGGGAARRW